MRSLKNLKALLQGGQQQWLTCKAAGESSNATFEVSIHHETSSPISQYLINKIGDNIGDQQQLFQFLKLYGSLRLYCDEPSDTSAFYIAKPHEWQELYSDILSWVDSLGAQDKGELIPPWFENAIVIGEAPSAGIYFLLVVKGAKQGRVYEFDHDGFEFNEISNDFDNFLGFISTVTDDLIEYISSYTRYSDGETNIQWVPYAYSASGFK